MENQKKRLTLKELPKRWFITAFTGMAHGLFATLIAGTILAQIASLIGDNLVGNILTYVASVAKMLMGAGIGVGIAHSLKAPKLVIFTAGVTGFVGAFADKIIDGTFSPSFAPGNPISAYVVSIITIEICLLYAGKTKLDIILVPIGMMVLCLGAVYVSLPFIWLIGLISRGIEIATGLYPFIMGIIVSVVMGVLLTMPTSSAAIWISIASGVTSDAMLLAGGAAVVGCCCHMVGFAVQSFRENGFGGLVAQGIGTSMLQIPNIMRKPIIILPPIIASAIAGPLSTTVFKLRCNAVGGGMGTSGLVGVFGTIQESVNAGLPTWQLVLGIALLMFIIPAVVCFFGSELMRKKNWISFGDMKIE
ncbi:MAG: PTS sugar transporter subunit IIC [Clostridia bacterium]|nr:PTS sugar transporter subunit IIC [Clostridia bacterium]